MSKWEDYCSLDISLTDIGDLLDLDEEAAYLCSDGSIKHTVNLNNVLQWLVDHYETKIKEERIAGMQFVVDWIENRKQKECPYCGQKHNLDDGINDDYQAFLKENGLEGG